MIRCIWEVDQEIPVMEDGKRIIMAFKTAGLPYDGSLAIVTEGKMLGLDITEEIFGRIPDLFEVFESALIPIILRERGLENAEVTLVGYQNI